MPTYDYLCDSTGRKVEVRHSINEELKTWGELCERAQLDPDDTPADTPVRRLISGGAFISSSSLSNPEPACASGACCPGGACGLPD